MRAPSAALLFLLLSTASPSAATITVPHSDRGAFQDTGRRVGGNQNTFTGTSRFGVWRSFFLFDLTGIPPVHSATLRLELETYLSSYAPSEAFSLFDVSASAHALLADYGKSTPLGKAIYNDLGTGRRYAPEVIVTYDDQGTVLEIR